MSAAIRVVLAAVASWGLCADVPGLLGRRFGGVRCAVVGTESGASGVSGCGHRRRRRRGTTYGGLGVRFACYGRMSTREFQNRETSRGWQREVAEATIYGRGVIVEEFSMRAVHGNCPGGSGRLPRCCWLRRGVRIVVLMR